MVYTLLNYRGVYSYLSAFISNFAVNNILAKMEQTLLIYNTLTRKKEAFKPLHAPNGYSAGLSP